MSRSPLIRRWGMSRRRFLQMTGSAAAAAMLPLRSSHAAFARVGVLGGGIAGLTAAYWLKKNGVPFNLCEAGSRLGGRVFTVPNWNSSGQFIELGGELLNSGDDETIWLLRRLEKEQAAANGNFVRQNLSLVKFTDGQSDPGLHRGLYLNRGQIYTQGEMDHGFAILLNKMAEMKKKIFAGFQGSNFTYREAGRFPQIAAWDHKSIAELLSLFKSEVDDWILDAVAGAFTAESGMPASEVTALNMLLLINTEAADGSIQYGEYDETLRLGGGNSSLVNALLNSLSDYGTTPLDRYISQGRMVSAVQRSGSSFQVNFNSGAPETFTHLIVAVPLTQLRAIDGWPSLNFSPVKLNWLQNLGMGLSSKVMLDFNGRPWRDSTVVGARACRGDIYVCDKGGDIWETSRMQAGAGGILTHYKTGPAASSGLQKSTLDVLREVYGGPAVPGYATGKIASFDWPNHALTQGAFSSLKPGQTAELWGAGREAECDGTLFFAGEHTSEKSQGYINGGVESALIAARAITRSLAFQI